ncbi:HD-GYP domain-containing protein [Treponema sp. R6D11]
MPLSKVLLSLDGKEVNKKYIDLIEEEEIPVLCINNNTKKERLMPFKTLYDNKENFWQVPDGTWTYFLSTEDYEKLKEKAVSKRVSWDVETPVVQNPVKGQGNKEEDLEELVEATHVEIEKGFGNEYKTIKQMTKEQKVERLQENKARLDDLITKKNVKKEVVTEALVDTTKSAALINHSALEDAIYHADDVAKELTQDLVDSTYEMVKSSAQLISEDIFKNELMNTMVEKSNGTVIQHMTRVYLNGIAFLSYYNKLVSGSSAIQKMRINFATEYRKYYHTLLPHIDIDDINLERVFYGGMRAIPPDDYMKWAVGFLIHDIGKANAVEYHEGESSYDRNIVIDHVKQGFKYTTTKTNYPKEASLIIGYHHEYYGDPDGYGFFRAYLANYRKDNPSVNPDFCISYELEPILDYHTLAYFPAKVLEIIDVFDSVTDPHRAYRKPLTSKEAIDMMREEFINKHLKIDPILFDIFAMFVNEKQKH